MTLFDSRNVLDRLQDTFTSIFNPEWKKNLAPFLILLAINIIGGVVIGLLVPILLIPVGMTSGSNMERGIMLGVFICVLVIGIALFYWITGNLVTICSYLIVRKKGMAFQPMELIREAMTYLKRALRFDGYYYSILSVILFVLFLLCLPFLRGMIGQILELSARPMDYHALAGGIAQALFLFGIFCLSFGVFSAWFSTRYLTNKPGYILEGGDDFSSFTSGKSITMGNFWNILGNLILLGIIVSIVGRTLSSLLSTIMGSSSSIDLGSLQNTTQEDFMNRIIPIITASFSGGSTGASMIISVIIGMLTGIYRNAFAYTLWNDLRTEVIHPAITTTE